MSRPVETRACAFPDTRFGEISGQMELAISAALQSGSRPARVDRILLATYREIDGEVPDPDSLVRLDTATREWLLQRAILHVGSNPAWFEAQCEHCGDRYDLALSLAAAPRKPAGAGYPQTSVTTSLGLRDFETPNGRHETALCELPPGLDLRRELVRLCGLDSDARSDADRFTAADLDLIDAALDELSPDIADSAETDCPECGEHTRARIDPFSLPLPGLGDLIEDIDRIARAYGWSEAEILALPRIRRRAYADRAARRPREAMR